MLIRALAGDVGTNGRTGKRALVIKSAFFGYLQRLAPEIIENQDPLYVHGSNI